MMIYYPTFIDCIVVKCIVNVYPSKSMETRRVLRWRRCEFDRPVRCGFLLRFPGGQQGPGLGSVSRSGATSINHFYLHHGYELGTCIYIYNYSFIYNIIFVYIYIPGFKFPLEFEGQISVSDSSGMWKKSNLLFFWNDRSPDHSDSNVFGAAGGRLFPKLQRGVGWKDLVLVFHRTSGVAQVQLQQINTNCTTVTCGSNRYGGISCSSFVFFLLLGQHLLWYFI
jgi:hypothetical protein